MSGLPLAAPASPHPHGRQVRYLVRWRSNHIYGRGRGELAASRDHGVEVVYAIPTMASFRVCPEGSHYRLGVRYQPEHPRLLRQPADVRLVPYCALEKEIIPHSMDGRGYYVVAVETYQEVTSDDEGSVYGDDKEEGVVVKA